MLIFEKVRYKNLLSVGNYFVEFDLDKYKNTVIIGKNGAAKSTIIVAIFYALFGKSFRKVKLQKLVNSINNKHLVVELEFSKHGVKYLVRRGMKPDIFEIFCDGKALNLEAGKLDVQREFERNVLEFNSKTFSQLMVLGTNSHVPFMELEAKERRAIIESFTDLEIFSVMNEIAKEKRDNIKNRMNVLENKLFQLKTERDSTVKYISKIQTSNKAKIVNIEESLTSMSNKLTELNKQIGETEQTRDNLEIEKYLKAKTSYTEKLYKCQKFIGSSESSIDSKKKQIKFYDTTPVCPTCHIEIDETRKSEFLDVLNSELLELNNKKTLVEDEIGKIRVVLSKIEEKEKSYNLIVSELNNHLNQQRFYNNEIKRLQNDLNELNVSNDCKEEEKLLVKIDEDEKNLLKEKQEILKEKNILETSLILLKDNGIKAKVISQYIDIINESINKYINKLDLFVRFELDENFDETIKSRHTDNFQYQSFSSGERHKIDLSILFMFIEIASRKNNIKTNLLLLDEVLDTSLDAESKLLAFNLIKNLEGKNSIIITHSEEIIESVNGRDDVLIKAEKKGNFSHYKKMN